MRMKYYTAASMTEGMAQVRAELGNDAIIISTQRAHGGDDIRITAALEETAPDEEINQYLSRFGHRHLRLLKLSDNVCRITVFLRVCRSGLLLAAKTVGTEDQTLATAGALDEIFSFAALPTKRSPVPAMLVGPPGVGKTITVAKLAARARIAGRSVAIISADSVRAGALEQLSAFTNILSVELKKARGITSLESMVSEATSQHDLVYIDTPGLNPFSPEDMGILEGLTRAVEVEPVLVLAAGGDPIEAMEIAESFATVGVSRLLATRLDMTRRLGAVLAAADIGQFMFCDVSINPHVANGLCPITPISMARLLVPPGDQSIASAPNDWAEQRPASPRRESVHTRRRNIPGRPP